MALALGRHPGESIMIGEEIELRFDYFDGNNAVCNINGGILRLHRDRQVSIGKGISVLFSRQENNMAIFAIAAPQNVRIDRKEIRDAKDKGLPPPPKQLAENKLQTQQRINK